MSAARRSDVGLGRSSILVVGLAAALLGAPPLLERLVPASWLMAAMTATAQVAAVSIRAVGIPCTLAGANRLDLTNHVFRIDVACTALVWVMLYVIAVVLIPVARKRKVQGLLFGVPVLLSFNLFRIVLIAFVSQTRPEYFAVVHEIVMQLGFVVVAMGVWAYWMWLSRNDWAPGWG